MMLILFMGILAAASAAPADGKDKENYKDQSSSSSGHVKHRHVDRDNCTDPRTMRKHAAYTEWADAYSCTRHRCQPGGRNLAIYTVGCKRVEAPESAIECEEVVEDTNMQFPFCCTRLRCLVVVRGEVWTRVLGQPWEVLPAAPWSHMYKMKKPPPTDTTFLPKTNDQGPIYELSEAETEGSHDKVLRSGKKSMPDGTDCNEVVPRAAPPQPDIVIALSTGNELSAANDLSGVNELKEQIQPSNKKFEIIRRSQQKTEKTRHKRVRKTTTSAPSVFEEDREKEREREGEKEKETEKHIEPEIELEELPTTTDKPTEASEEKFFANTFAVTSKPKNVHHQTAWNEIPQNQWHEHEGMDVENKASEPTYHQPEFQAQEAPEPTSQPIIGGLSSLSNNEKPPHNNLQALVDAIGTRMRDIENVVQKMSEKVHQAKPGAVVDGSNEKRLSGEQDGSHKHHKAEVKRPNPEDEHYKSIKEVAKTVMGNLIEKFTVRNQGSKYLHSTPESTTELPLFLEETNLTGYFSDASNSVVRRNNPPKEPPPTYMAPVETRRRAPAHIALVSDNDEDADKKRKKHTHKKKRNKTTHSHKKHRSKEDKRKHFNRLSSGEIEKNIVSMEDSSALAKK